MIRRVVVHRGLASSRRNQNRLRRPERMVRQALNPALYLRVAFLGVSWQPLVLLLKTKVNEWISKCQFDGRKALCFNAFERTGD